jgi:hypothetical protein
VLENISFHCNLFESQLCIKIEFLDAAVMNMAPLNEPLPTLDLETLQENLVATINGRFDALERRFANLERDLFGDASSALDGEASSDSDNSSPAPPDSNGKRRMLEKSAEEKDKRKKSSSSQD